jgi:uncharacterized protein DUF4845
MRKQRGLGLLNLILGLFVLVILGVFGMKLVPSYIEFRTAKNAIDAISRERQGSTVADIRRAFEARAVIDDITSVKPQDLEITKSGNEVVIGFSYRKEVSLFGGVGVYIDYTATSRPN